MRPRLSIGFRIWLVATIADVAGCIATSFGSLRHSGLHVLLVQMGAGLTLLAFVFQFPWARRRLQREEWKRQGRCMECGYDLRATPERCPECGAVASK